MTIRELRILPPFAIGRLGSATRPLDNYTIEDDSKHPLGFRRIVGGGTLEVDEQTGEIRKSETRPVTFKENGRIRPVAPFLEVFSVTDGDRLQPLDLHVLESLEAKIEWRVTVANRKVERRTGNQNNLVSADTLPFSDHEPHRLLGQCPNFIEGATIDFGHVRFIRPNKEFPQIRLRFTPATGLIYGPTGIGPNGESDDQVIAGRAIYKRSEDWFEFGKVEVQNETVPPSLYAINPPAPSWLNDNIAISRGYLDDSCDGFVEVCLTLPDGQKFTAKARICAGPPALVPDSLFVRCLADDLEQVIEGPSIDPNEAYEVTRDRAADIVRRAYETVRFMNVAVMNGNNFKGRSSLDLDSMPEEEAADTERAIRPIMGPGTVDTLAILALHEQVFAALRGGAAPWFVSLLRQPDEVADFTDRGRRKMPALMCGADNNYLALTYRQIDTIRQAAEKSLFHTKKTEPPPAKMPEFDGAASFAALRPRNLSAQLHYAAAGNPISSRPVTSVANCCPGLEVDFRAVWRRMFEGIELREYDNLVVEDQDPGPRSLGARGLTNHRLLRVRLPEREPAVMAKQEELRAKEREVREAKRAIPEVELATLQEELGELQSELAVLKNQLAFSEESGVPALEKSVDARKQAIREKQEAIAKKRPTAAQDEQAIPQEKLDLLKKTLSRLKKERGDLEVELMTLEKQQAFLMMTEMKGPASSDTEGEIRLTTDANPEGLAALEWSNALAHLLKEAQGKEVWCDFTKEKSEQQQPVIEDPKNYISFKFKLRPFFEDKTAVISEALAKAGELTQGLCSPWQNDYRECSCYYWASARPDYINVESGPDGLSRGDNWLQKERTGSYVPDDYSDSRLILYDDLFEDWEKYLKFQIGGRDAPDERASDGKESGS